MFVNIKISKALPAKAFKYAIGKNVLEQTEKRNLLTNKSPEREMRETAQRFGKWTTDKERKTFSLVISPNPADNPSQEQLMEVTNAVLDHYFANIQGIIVLHKDRGKDAYKTKPILHAHFYGSVIDPISGHNIHLSDSDVRRIRAWADAYAQEHFGWKQFERGNRNAGRTFRKSLMNEINNRGRWSWMNELRNIITDVYLKAISFSDFQMKLYEKGIKIKQNEMNSNELQFVLTVGNKIHKVNATTLDERFSASKLRDKFLETDNKTDDRNKRTYETEINKTKMVGNISGSAKTNGTGESCGQRHVSKPRINFECILCTQDKSICRECTEYHPERGGDSSHGSRTR